MASSEPIPDPAQPDLYWVGPSGWAMMPYLVVIGTVSGLSWLGVPHLAELLGLDNEWTTFILFQVILFTWVVFGLRWAYRAACVVARLTPQRIYLDYGPLYRPTPPIELKDIVTVETTAGPLDRLLHVGDVMVLTLSNRRVKFVGLNHPEQFVAALNEAMGKVKGL